MALTAKQTKFIDEYMIDLNATQAAIRAGYSANTASETGYENLRKPQIAAEIEKRQQKHAEETGMTVEWVLQQYKDIILNTKDEDPAVARSALDSVGKHLGMFKDRTEIDLKVSKKLEEFFS
ncbi:terminase small subunit [Paenibacillus sp. UASWS1643]|uniref:terminase small subunit n=1 Tax=Paenibacillus sp. UASWS1643 TaxID=2580422 RepID=UPI00123C04F2|nr:terminase small subunit [Paenibacillus sp. UASWS1643]KAA8747118.1 terminase small subunit [Paenibacillus sp. UASWS1643]